MCSNMCHIRVCSMTIDVENVKIVKSLRRDIASYIRQILTQRSRIMCYVYLVMINYPHLPTVDTASVILGGSNENLAGRRRARQELLKRIRQRRAIAMKQRLSGNHKTL